MIREYSAWKQQNKVNEEDKDKAYGIILHGNETSMNE